jgi:hypothetical protein
LQLGNLLTDPPAAENLGKSNSKKEEVTGQTCRQTPIGNETALKNALNVLPEMCKAILVK